MQPSNPVKSIDYQVGFSLLAKNTTSFPLIMMVLVKGSRLRLCKMFKQKRCCQLMTRGIGVSQRWDTQRVVNKAELSQLVQSPGVDIDLLGIVTYTTHVHCCLILLPVLHDQTGIPVKPRGWSDVSLDWTFTFTHSWDWLLMYVVGDGPCRWLW